MNVHMKKGVIKEKWNVRTKFRLDNGHPKAIRANNPDLLGAQEINDHAFEVIGHFEPDYKVSTNSDYVIKLNWTTIKHSRWQGMQ